MNDVARRIAALSPEKRALLAKKMATSGEPAARLADDPVAVIGLSCRFPGAESAGAFWELLHSGADGGGDGPPERWGAAALPDPSPGVAGKTVSRWGGFLRDVDRFDAAFFGISPREAAQ